jgi:hypothetical protein
MRSVEEGITGSRKNPDREDVQAEAIALVSDTVQLAEDVRARVTAEPLIHPTRANVVLTCGVTASHAGSARLFALVEFSAPVAGSVPWLARQSPHADFQEDDCPVRAEWVLVDVYDPGGAELLSPADVPPPSILDKAVSAVKAGAFAGIASYVALFLVASLAFVAFIIASRRS